MIKLLIALMIYCLWVPAFADNEQGRPIGVGLTGGTLGVGLTVTTPIIDGLNARALLSGLSLSRDGDTDDVEYDGNVDFFFAGGLLDYHPFHGGFRLSLGALYNGINIKADGKCRQATCDVGDTDDAIRNGDRVDGDIDFNTIAPYLGLGWGNASDTAGRWSFSFDLGALYVGEADASLRCTRVSGPPANQATCDAAIGQEEDDLNNDIADFEFYPVLMVGAAYRFW